MKTTYIAPKAETVSLLSSQNLLQGSPNGSLNNMDPNGIINEGF